MNDAQQIRLFATLPRDDSDALFVALDPVLEEAGHALSVFETHEDSGIFELSVYAAAGERENLTDILQKTAQSLAINPTIQVEILPDEDWVTKSLEGLQPVRVGRFIVHGSHDRDRVRLSDIGIEIEAGQAFGTGHHGTTAGCLDMMSRVIRRRRPRQMLDVGTGSAVLAIAAGKAWKLSVLATDIDPIAVDVARRNAALNDVAQLVDCRVAAGFAHARIREKGPYDLIVANILARPLMKMAPHFAVHLAPGGDMILSGILATQRHKVLAAFRQQGLYHQRTLWREGWVTLHLRAKTGS
ncbi:MAG: 50S ribosomal protein L11 methyltransferase [Pseudomonadota bacterium]